MTESTQSATKASDTRRGDTVTGWVSALALAVALTCVFWWPLWYGGGLIGGDLYPYYFPQKQFLTHSLHEGRIPLWNNLVGLGYPVLGESQTGALYPPNLVLYRLFDMNTAYNISQIAHYVLAFLGAWGLSRQLGLRTGGALLAALVYVYGWFPARICLEWAIIGGACLVWILWLLVRYRLTHNRRLLGAMALLFGADLLAGHYNLAFITLLLAVILALVPRRFLGSAAQPADGSYDDRTSSVARNLQPQAYIGRFELISLMLAVVCGFLIAAVQLIPTWELKSRSQRVETGEAFTPGYGHLPPLAITQLVAPWMWHSPDIDTDKALNAASLATIPAATNKAEGFVYAGLVPLLLVLYGWIRFRVLPPQERRRIVLWTSVGAVSLFFATGWPIIWLQWAPGFSYFTGPGRYTIVTTLAIGVLAGTLLDCLLERWRLLSRGSVVVLVIAVTCADHWAVSREYQFGNAPYSGRQVFYATLVNAPPINFVDESTIGRILSNWPDPRHPAPARLYAPGPNVATLTGHSAIPVYLGIGPKLYAERPMRFDFWGTPGHPPEIEDVTTQLKNWGVTHLLLEKPLDESRWPARLLFQGTDPLLNAAFGRLEPFYLYELADPPRRAYLAERSAGIVNQVSSEPNRVTVAVTANQHTRLVVSELMYPGWGVTVDGRRAQPVAGTVFRTVDLLPGEHRVVWTYHPRSVLIGAVFSVLGLIAAIGLLLVPARSAKQRSKPPPVDN